MGSSPKNLCVIGYGVMGAKPLRTNLVDAIFYGLRELMGYQGYGLRGSWLYVEEKDSLCNKIPLLGSPPKSKCMGFSRKWYGVSTIEWDKGPGMMVADAAL